MMNTITKRIKILYINLLTNEITLTLKKYQLQKSIIHGEKKMKSLPFLHRKNFVHIVTFTITVLKN